MSAGLLYDRHGHVRLITLHRPEKMNSLDFQASSALVEICTEFNADSEARVAVITVAGKRAFCAGADLKTYTMNFALPVMRLFSRTVPKAPSSVKEPAIPSPSWRLNASGNAFRSSTVMEITSLVHFLSFNSFRASFRLQQSPPFVPVVNAFRRVLGKMRVALGGCDGHPVRAVVFHDVIPFRGDGQGCIHG